MRGCFVAKAHNRVRSIPNGKEAGFCRRQHDHKIKVQLAFIAIAVALCRSDHACPNTSAQKIPAKIANWQTRRKIIIACCTTNSSSALRGEFVG
jgi:hypothetical protein